MNERETGGSCANCGHREGQHCEIYSGHAGCCAACVQFCALVCTAFRPARCQHERVSMVVFVRGLKFLGQAEMPVSTQVDLCAVCHSMRAVVQVGTRRLETSWVGP